VRYGVYKKGLIMTQAANILRVAEDRPLLRATPLLDRLSLIEDRLRAYTFLDARPRVCAGLMRALGALRPVCSDRRARVYVRDMRALADQEPADIVRWLHESGFDEEAITAWFEYAESSLSLYRTEDGHFTDRAFFCELHDVWYSRRTQAHEVVVRWRNGVRTMETWSDDAVEEAAFYCDGSQRYYASSAFDAGQPSFLRHPSRASARVLRCWRAAARGPGQMPRPPWLPLRRKACAAG
jgi:hypothetical protein